MVCLGLKGPEGLRKALLIFRENQKYLSEVSKKLSVKKLMCPQLPGDFEAPLTIPMSHPSPLDVDLPPRPGKGGGCSIYHRIKKCINVVAELSYARLL